MASATTICKQPFGANLFTRCFTLQTYTFGQQNVYVWPAKHVRLANKTCTFARQKRVCLAGKTCTFGCQNVYQQNVYVWPTKRVCLANKTCMFGCQNVYVWPAKRTRLAFKITSLGRGLSTFDEQRPHFNKT